MNKMQEMKLYFSLFLHVDFEPSCFKEDSTNEFWVQAMQEETYSNHSNDSWELRDILHGKKKFDTKWVYKTNYNRDGTVERHKARLVAKGFT